MSGIESERGTSSDANIPFPLRVVRDSSNEIARYRGLDTLTAEALSKFALINFRIKDIAEDFRGTATRSVGYPMSANEEGITEIWVVSREGYPDMLRDLSTRAFNLYNTYLSGSENTRAAAKEVQGIVIDLFPPHL
mgnify:CR=1 FL=1